MNITKNENGIMSKKSFCKVMDDYKFMLNFTDELNEVFDKYKCDGYIYPPVCTETVIDLLELIFDDKDKWIGYWAWELDFGERYEDGDVQDEYGNNIPLKTVEDLYDLLIDNMKENGEYTN